MLWLLRAKTVLGALWIACACSHASTPDVAGSGELNRTKDGLGATALTPVQPIRLARQANPEPESEPGPGPGPKSEPGPAPTCFSAKQASAQILSEPGGPKREYSVDGYLGRWLAIEWVAHDVRRTHCVLVAWPAGSENRDGGRVRVAADIHDGWLAGLKNTFSRIPWHHAKLVERVVIDNRPTEHGIAAFDRQRQDDGRDGHTIWLHEHLFRDRNHWSRGNHGSYWSYHTNEEGRSFHTSAPDHTLYSPVLLHEIGHLVMYHLVNRPAIGAAATSAPDCAKTCGDVGGCRSLPLADRERGCISPYCMPFRFETGTENWAEQYRFYYQGSRTRALLSEAGVGCLSVLREHDRDAVPPWQSGLPDMQGFRRSVWDSCAGKPCKRW